MPMTEHAINAGATQRRAAMSDRDLPLRACPFCGGSTLGWYDLNSGSDVREAWWIVECMVCGAHGPSTATLEEAWKRWNGRCMAGRSAWGIADG